MRTEQAYNGPDWNRLCCASSPKYYAARFHHAEKIQWQQSNQSCF